MLYPIAVAVTFNAKHCLKLISLFFVPSCCHIYSSILSLFFGKIGSITLKDPEIRKIPPKDRGHIKYHWKVGIWTENSTPFKWLTEQLVYHTKPTGTCIPVGKSITQNQPVHAFQWANEAIPTAIVVKNTFQQLQWANKHILAAILGI